MTTTPAKDTSAQTSGLRVVTSSDLLFRIPRWLGLGYGVMSVLLGIAILAWPGATLLVAITLLAIQLIISGVLQAAVALGTDFVSGGDKALYVLGAAFSLLVGLLVLRKPLQSLIFVTLLVGASWVMRGVAEAVGSLPGGSPNRWWNIGLGLLSVVAGAYVLTNPGLSLGAFVLVAGLWMIVHGAGTVAAVVLSARAP